MKKLLIIFSLFLYTITSPQVLANETLDGEVEKLCDEILAEIKTPEDRATIEAFLIDQETRAIQESTTKAAQGADNVEFLPSAYDQNTNRLYLGATSKNSTQAAIVRARTKFDDPHDIEIIALAPGISNPLYDKTISNIALVGSSNKRSLAVVDNTNITKVSLINNLNDGSMGLQSLDLNDVNGAVVNAVWNVAGTDDINPIVFAAVSKNGNTWKQATSDTDDGIASLKIAGDGSFKQTNANDISDFSVPKATAIKFQSQVDNVINDRMVAFKPAAGTQLNAAKLGSDKVAMHYDPSLKRLFIGLNQVQTNNIGDGGILSLLVANIDTDGKTPLIKPIIANPSTTIFPTAQKNTQIIGAGSNTTDFKTPAASTLQVKTMHTSTNKDYVIVNGGTVDQIANIANVNSWVYALPVMPASNANAGQLAVPDLSNLKNPFVLVDGSAKKILIAVDQTHTSPAYGAGTAFTSGPTGEATAVVGADPRFLADPTQLPIETMQVIGDTVYVSVAGIPANGLESKSGIFQSTAIFDENGLIRMWTPWQRVAGQDGRTHKVSGFGLNNEDGSFQFLAQDDSNKYTKISSDVWGSPATNTLIDQVAASFTTKNGMYKMINFDEQTPGFKKGEFSMIIAVGGDLAVITQTGSLDGKLPVQSIIKLNDQAIKDIAPLTSAAFINDKPNNKAYVLIGGLGGIVRIDQDNTGAGADTSLKTTKGITDVGTFANKTLKKIGDYTNVVDLQKIADNGNCIVATLDKVFSIQAADANNPEKIVKTMGGADVSFTKPFIFDVQNSQNMMIAATTQGIVAMNTPDATLIPFPAIQGTPVQLQFLHDKKGGGDDGNLYVLSVDRDKNTGLVYRFDINGNTVTPIDFEADDKTPRPLKDLEQFTHLFSTDGNTTFIGRSREINSQNLLQVSVNINNNTDTINVIDDLLNIPADTKPLPFIGTPIRNTADGSWLVPGSFGVRVNE